MPTFGRETSGRRRRTARAAAFGEARGVLIAIAQEAHDVALLVAVTGSIVNAIVASKRPQLRVSMATYLPHQPTAFPAAIGTNAISAALPATTIQALTAFYGLVTFARTATLGYSARREPGGITGPISMDTIGEAWQAAATQAIGVLSQLGYLDPRSPLTSRHGTNPAALRLIEMLWSVTLGRTPCVRIDGAVVVPGWIDRRTALAPGNQRARRGQGQRRVARRHVRDLSAGGFGIDGGTGSAPATASQCRSVRRRFSRYRSLEPRRSDRRPTDLAADRRSLASEDAPVADAATRRSSLSRRRRSRALR